MEEKNWVDDLTIEIGKLEAEIKELKKEEVRLKGVLQDIEHYANQIINLI